MKKRIKSVWIEDGCIPDCSCEFICPIVFKFPTDEEYQRLNLVTSKINGKSRIDGITSTNKFEKSELNREIGIDCYELIIEAANACPVEVIKFIEDKD